MNKKMIWLPVFVFSVALSQPIFATDTDAKGSKPASCTCMKKAFKTLGLTPEQEAKIKAIRTQANLVKLAKRQEIVTINNQIQALVRDDKLDDTKLDVLLEQKKQLMATMIKNKVLVKHQIASVLTAQQKTKYDELMKSWEEQRMKKLDKAAVPTS